MKTRRDRFDEVPDTYERARALYRPEILAALQAQAALGPGVRVLEIGCGTGQLTRDLLPFGVTLTAIEPGRALADKARTVLPESVRIDVARFEDWNPGDRRFDVVVAAQSLHWIDPAQRFDRIAHTLVPGGICALIWTLDRSEHSDFYRATQPVYERAFPPSSPGESLDLPSEAALACDQLTAHAAFGPISTTRVNWTRTMNTETYLDLRRTDSNVRALPEDRRREFLDGLRAVLQRFGGQVAREYETLLFATHRS